MDNQPTTGGSLGMAVFMLTFPLFALASWPGWNTGELIQTGIVCALYFAAFLMVFRVLESMRMGWLSFLFGGWFAYRNLQAVYGRFGERAEEVYPLIEFAEWLVGLLG